MYVSAHHVISVHYTLTDDDNALIDSTYDDNKPMVYLHGRGQMIIGFEQAVAKAGIGEKRNFTVAPNEGYGLRNVNNTQRLSLIHI